MLSLRSAAIARDAPAAIDLDDAPAAGGAEVSPIADPRLHQAHDYWRRKARGRALPRRVDIDPTDIPRLLPDVMLVEVRPEGRYRYRLIGTENALAHGMNATGRYLDEVLPGPGYKDHVIALYDECVGARRALYSECLFMAPDRRAPERHTKVLFMPLASDGETVDMVFVVQVFFYIDQATRERHFIDARPYKEIAHVLL
jgi:PAS domain-containing protein